MLRAIGIVVPVSILLAACGLGRAESTPTLSADDVLGTAQAYAEATRNAATPTPSATEPPPTPTVPLSTATPSATATLNFPVVTAKYNVAVRSGPGEVYEAIDLFLQGQTAQVIGRYDDTDIGTWWSILRIGQGLNGWVWSGAVDLGGDVAGIPVLEPPPTPEDDDDPEPTTTP
ncbi:MAG TPA: SH3 domain-containing protein [Anaerolineales bacterium]|nr:SH3 domain-containing protein [Anaerolineales bacterium]